MVEWPNKEHVDSEVRLVDLTKDERAVAHRIIFARTHAKRVALAAVRAVRARAAAAEGGEGREAGEHARRRCSRLVEEAEAAREAPARALVSALVSNTLRRVVAAAATADGEAGDGAGEQREQRVRGGHRSAKARRTSTASGRRAEEVGSEGEETEGEGDAPEGFGKVDKIVEVGVGAQGAEALVRWECDQGG